MSRDEYSYYYPMQWEDAKRLSTCEANKYTLDKLCREVGYTPALTDSERQSIQGVLTVALQRAGAGIAEFDTFKREKPILVYGGGGE